jgi:hydroxyacylglutathione hydrolase
MISLQPKLTKIRLTVLHLESFTFNPFQENTYLLYNDQKQCWIVDPGMYGPEEDARMLHYITSNGLQPQSIINTHSHIDHITGIQTLVEKYKIPFGIHELDQPLLRTAVASAMMFGLDLKTAPKPDFFIKGNEPISLKNDILDVRFAPGHAPGHVVFYYPEGGWLIAGDVLFNGSIGRTDLPGGNFDTLINSIRTQLFTLPDDTIVYPGHGPSTTIGNEKKHNPFLQS